VSEQEWRGGGWQDPDGRIYVGGYDVGEPPEARFSSGDRGRVLQVYAGPDAGWVHPDGEQAPYPDGLRGIPGHSRIDDPDGEHYYDYDPPPRGTDPDGLGRLRNWMSRHNTERVQDPRAEEYNDGARSVKREKPALDAETALEVLRIENRHSRVTEFRREWRDTGDGGQVRAVW